ncbi:tail assembly chaperone [Providencia alcalifaciens]|uniref:Tail assembly chaperone n=1 Tax=Providencia alcalifaciens TaxID=126385 RepID=A0A4R3NSI5_9GAMM|nr:MULTISPECIES: phage tail assembly chaperone [Providencia]MBC5790256.1 phage tail protein [Providencia sp. JUb39]TCT38784.1 tail assembly chaperone [Providencia alcalifaciens]
MTKAKKSNLRDLALSASQSFRTKKVRVPEWDCDVVLREPSVSIWLKWLKEHRDLGDTTELSTEDVVRRNLEADVEFLINVLLEENLAPVFVPEDKDEVLKIYGPVHARLVNQAFQLITSTNEAEKKSVNLH